MSNWRQWDEQPPQIPFAPIEVTNQWGDEISLSYPYKIFWPALGVSSRWRPTGIYRQEYFEVTGQWL